jgi:hypothetical protein
MTRGAQRPSLHRSQYAGIAHNTNGFPLYWCGNGRARGPGALHAAALPAGLYLEQNFSFLKDPLIVIACF